MRYIKVAAEKVSELDKLIKTIINKSWKFQVFKVIKFVVKLSKYDAYEATHWSKPHCGNEACLQPIVENVTGPKRLEGFTFTPTTEIKLLRKKCINMILKTSRENI